MAMITKAFDVHLGEPLFYLSDCDISDFCNFQWKFNEASNEKICSKMFRGHKCITANGLFDEFSAVLQFPYYFGYNWNSFDECLNDLQWMSADAYILCISQSESILKLPNEDFKALLTILLSAGQAWESGRDLGALTTLPTPFKVVFHCTKGTSQEIITKFHDLGIKLAHL